MMQSGNDFDAKDLHVCERVYAGVGARCVCYNKPAILEACRSDIVKLMLQKPEHLLHHLARVGVVGGISQVVGALGAAVGWDGALLDQTIQSFGPLGLANIDQFDVHIKHQNTNSAENQANTVLYNGLNYGGQLKKCTNLCSKYIIMCA